MRRREIITLAMPDIVEPVYFAGPKYVPTSFSYCGIAWLTKDINRAKVWRHPNQALAVEFAHREAWAPFSPRIFDPRTVAGYVDKPSRVARRSEVRRSRWGGT
jgi:hypothetical protein